MKKFFILLLLIATMCKAKAQDIEITKFERNYTSLIASMDPVYDNTGEACAVIRFFVRGDGFIIEPNMGMMKQETKPGEIRVWVPRGTKRLTIRKEGLLPLTGYSIPMTIEPKVTYETEVIVHDGANKHHNVYGGIGYNALSISGPSVALGFDVNHHNIELGAVYGLNKTDDMYFYDSNSDGIGDMNGIIQKLDYLNDGDTKTTDDLGVEGIWLMPIMESESYHKYEKRILREVHFGILPIWSG